MRRIAITGGIGSGKSYVCRVLTQHCGISVYDCDAAAKRLMRSSARLRQALTQLIGPDTYLPESGMLNKAVVAQFLLRSDANKKAIDDIVHPEVADDFLNSGKEWLESAILFESGFNKRVSFDAVVVVTAPEEVRLQRIMQRDNIAEDRARQWIERQWPQQKVAMLSDYEIINDGQQPLLPQIERIVQQTNTLL